MNRFLTKLFATAAKRRAVHAPITHRHKGRLQIECLEARQLLATLAAGIDARATDLVVNDSSNGPTDFPGEQFLIRIDSEEMEVTIPVAVNVSDARRTPVYGKDVRDWWWYSAESHRARWPGRARTRLRKRLRANSVCI